MPRRRGESPAGTTGRGPRDRWQRPPAGLLFLLWFLAFAHRLFLLLGNRDRSWPFPVFYEGDAETFHDYAQAILRGVPYDAGIPFHPPLFPVLLAALHALLGDPVPQPALRIVLAAIFALHVPLLFLLLRRFFAFGPALAAALLATYSFGLALISIAAVSEGLYLLFLLGALICFQDLKDTPGAAGREAPPPGVMLRAVGLGLTLGLAALTRAEGLGLAAVLLLWGAGSSWRAGGSVRARGLRGWLLAAGVLAVVLTPWTVRNAVQLSRINRVTAAEGLEPLPTFVVTTAYGPLNFALANHEKAPGWFDRGLLRGGAQPGTLNLRDPQHREVFLHGYRHGLSFITAHPGAYLRLCAVKLRLLSRALHTGWTQWDLPGGLTGTRYPVDLFTPDSPSALFAHLFLLGAGTWFLLRHRVGARAWLSPRRDAAFLVLVGVLVALSVLTTVAFFGYARQGVLLLPLLFGLEAVALAAAGDFLGRRFPALARPAGGFLPRGVWVLVIGLFAAELAGAFQDRNYIATGETLPGSQMLNRDSIMRLHRAP